MLALSSGQSLSSAYASLIRRRTNRRKGLTLLAFSVDGLFSRAAVTVANYAARRFLASAITICLNQILLLFSHFHRCHPRR
jgi:uncharacterized membrane protein YfcA